MKIEKVLDRFVVKPGKKVSLRKDFPTDWVPKGLDREEADRLLAEGVTKLAEHQDKLYAQNTYALLLVFQAMDGAGKDSTIKHVMSGVNPTGCQVFSFKAPSSEELDHDYLWRSYKALPERGRIGIFNRSYYEEVLVVRVHPEILERQQLPAEARGKDVWERRYREINNFERHLVDNGVVVLKFFLNVSKQEQKRRFLERIDEPSKNWKFSLFDLKERDLWPRYQRAYEEMLAATSTRWAPWRVVPADQKWFMRLVVAAEINRTLKGLGLRYPELSEQQRRELAQAKRILQQEK